MTEKRPKRVAFIGLGVMGYPMAGHLAAAGYETVVFNRTPARAEQWRAEHQGRRAATPAEAARDADVVLICVGNDDDVREVATGPDGVFDGVKQGAVVVDHTTASATLARELEAVAAGKGVGFLDAPVSGGQAGAENGQLSVMVGGRRDTFERALPVLEAYSKAVTLIGESGSGQLAKMVNQVCIAGIVQGLAEGLAFAKRAGLDPALLIEAIGKGAAQSWQMDNRWQTMVAGEFEFGFAVDWMRKDLAIALEEAERLGI
ncbi:MAG: NAD(P)-dependent oxidoreductase, partial [Woeseiaceae bacterium]|nr:NAD(P)-dependent oxidoreductase [Woeseiaceae bacterium]